MTQNPLQTGEANPFASLRRFARHAPVQGEEHCDMCGEAIGAEHRHLLDLSVRQILCVCRACALLLDRPDAGAGTRRLIPERYFVLDDLELTDEQWDALQIPVNVAFFCYHSAVRRVLAFYPSPMGPTESQLPLAAWDELTRRNPILRQLEPDVEALLVYRGRDRADYYLVPIDECYKLVGLIRLHWKGLGGGSEVRQQIDRFFAGLKVRACPPGAAHA